MGRTLAVRTFLIFIACAAFVLPPAANAAPAYDDWDELQAWLSQLCFVVRCEAARVSGEQSELSGAEVAAARFVMAFQSNGMRTNLTPEERKYAVLSVEHATALLESNLGRLDPEIERALGFTLMSIRSDLGK